MNVLLYLGVGFAIIYISKYLVEKSNIPSVTGYVIVGVLLGGSILKVFKQPVVEEFAIISDIALGIIAFSIGVELKTETIKKLGKSIIAIAFLEAGLAFCFVSLGLYLIMPQKLSLVLLLGSVASATAPAATVYIINQYRAKGPLTSTILSVVGIDDAISLSIYVVVSSFVVSMLSGNKIDPVRLALIPIIKILISLAIGVSLGLLYTLIFRKIRHSDDLSIGLAATILISMGVSELLKVSELLTVMSLGFILVNTDKMLANRSNRVIETLSPVFLPLFFMFAGARLNILHLGKIGLIGLLYTALRFSGKIAGSVIGATITGAPKTVRKFTGLSLFPQVGVAIALSLAIQKTFGRGDFGQEGIIISDLIINLLLFTTVITETLGPFLTRFSLKKAGEINMRD